MPVNILIPRNASPPYQAIVWFPGSYALELKHSDGDLPFSYYFDYLPRSGRALVTPGYNGTYERARRSQSVSQRRDTVRQWSQDLSRTVDYLNSRSDFDRYNWLLRVQHGGGPCYPGRCTGAAIQGRGPPRWRAVRLSLPPESQSLNFLPRLKTPVLLLGGRYDFYYSVEASQKPLFNLLGTPAEHKRHVIFENAGHVPPRIDVIREVLGWFDRYMGPFPAYVDLRRSSKASPRDQEQPPADHHGPDDPRHAVAGRRETFGGDRCRHRSHRANIHHSDDQEDRCRAGTAVGAVLTEAQARRQPCRRQPAPCRCEPSVSRQQPR